VPITQATITIIVRREVREEKGGEGRWVVVISKIEAHATIIVGSQALVKLERKPRKGE
jgi:hypothetical protein